MDNRIQLGLSHRKVGLSSIKPGQSLQILDNLPRKLDNRIQLGLSHRKVGLSSIKPEQCLQIVGQSPTKVGQSYPAWTISPQLPSLEAAILARVL
ncbi:hypothetical protein ACIQYS_11740 [Psychrobacillus sp. NPDC096426]|uniref:hypothetical protein n=1 Tax=Psychrobacillus sp. NPDC096426 TaxID=3364491 RepID=UPI0038122A67